MTLAETYDEVGASVVAFISKLSFSETGQPPLAPSILGTGFLIHSDGIVVTNRHVIDVFEKLPKDPRDNSIGAAVVMFITGRKDGRSYLRWALLEMRGYTTLGTFSSTGPWYGEDVPDIGFVQLAVRGTPFLRLATEDYYVRIGMPIATAGFPLGSQPLTVMEKLNQITPFLRRGIISSLYPFGIPHPHGFTIDVMQQGGSSGSPIFREDEPIVVGMMAASVLEHNVVQHDTLALRVSHKTNISIAVPSATIEGALQQFKKDSPWDPTVLPSLEDYHKGKPMPQQLGWEILAATAQ
jgi:S1-C subfamily serine protease